MLKKGLLALLTLLVLSACGNKDEKLSDAEREQVIDDGTIGFEMNGDKVEAAKNVPAEDEKAILAAFDEYINALNAEEIDRYMQTLSKNPKGFDYDEDKVYATEAFEQYNSNRKVDNVTIAKYSEKEAQVYANIKMQLLQVDTNIKHDIASRQVTVFVKEDGNWKVTSVHHIVDDAQSNTQEQETK